MAVCPIENELYYTEDDLTPIDKRNSAQNSALTNMEDNFTILDTNLVFGSESYLVHYMTQCVLAGRIPFDLKNPNAAFKFNPLHVDDVASAVKH